MNIYDISPVNIYVELTLSVLGNAFEAWHINVMQLPKTVQSRYDIYRPKFCFYPCCRKTVYQLHLRLTSAKQPSDAESASQHHWTLFLMITGMNLVSFDFSCNVRVMLGKSLFWYLFLLGGNLSYIFTVSMLPPAFYLILKYVVVC